MVDIRQVEHAGRFILYDQAHIPQIQPQWFDPEYWAKQGLVSGQAPGRGSTYFIQTPAGQAALRHYCRGGLPGRFIQDRYLWTGLARTRAWQEWHLTQTLFASGLPVPRPLAAQVVRRGLTYQADLITERLADVISLQDFLPQADQTDRDRCLHQLGTTLWRFHQFGLDHTDLNPRNILVSRGTLQSWLIDFDRCRLIQPQPSTQHSNLQRLNRALVKIDSQRAAHWMIKLKQAYQAN